MNLTIGQAAKKMGLSIHTLRYYEKEGLLPQIGRNDKGVRFYTPDDVKWIYMICCLRDTGMPIQAIKNYVSLFKQGKKTVSERKNILIGHQEEITRQIKLFQMVQHLINKKIEYYSQIESSDISDSCYDYFDEWELFKKILEEQFNV